jgi:hypothetical protein
MVHCVTFLISLFWYFLLLILFTLMGTLIVCNNIIPKGKNYEFWSKKRIGYVCFSVYFYDSFIQPGVNFINILRTYFAPIFWPQKYKSWNVTIESCSICFCTKNAHVKCWWNQLLFATRHLWLMKVKCSHGVLHYERLHECSKWLCYKNLKKLEYFDKK